MFFEKVLEYFQTHLIETAIIGGIALVMLIAIIALIATGAKAKKRKSIVAAIQESPAIESAPVEKPTPAATEEQPTVGAIQESPVVEPAGEPAVEPAQPSEPTPAQEETAAAADTPASTTTEEQPSVGAIQESTAPTPAPAKPAQPKKEKSPKAAKSALAATKKMGNETKDQPATTQPAPKAEKQTKAPATTPAQSSEPAPVKPAKPTQAKKEKSATEPTKRYTGKWVVCKLILADDNDQATEERYFFELRASNGERLLVSEEYLSYQGALKGIQTHKDNAEKGNFRITVSKKGDYIFKLLTAKNTLLCTGANYKSLERCESAVASTKRFAATAILQDEVEEVRIKLPAEDDTPVSQPAEGYEGKWIIFIKGDETVGKMYYFELFASNGAKLLTSEEYTTYEGAVNAVDTHKTNIAKGNFRISITKRGDYIFKLLGGNGQLLCLGEHYKTRSRCESAVESVKRFSESAPVLKHGDVQ